MNAIERYFENNKDDSPAALAKRIGRSASTITRAIKGERNASMNLARDIERGTDGKLTASEFLNACLQGPTRPEANGTQPAEAQA